MGRHFISTLTCMSVLCVSLLLSILVNAAPRERPSFDCRQAASPSEKTICANAALCRLDFQLGRTWETLLAAFIAMIDFGVRICAISTRSKPKQEAR
jgi:hypothetical protein